jgi:hypothetical protein
MTTYKEIFGKYVKNYSSDPTADIEGQIWYNTTSGTFKSNINIGGAWATGGNLPVTNFQSGGAGPQTANVIFGGTAPPGAPQKTAATFEYDGSTWSPSGNMNTSRTAVAGAGTQTTALGAGGYLFPGSSSAAETYNGSTWTSITSMPSGNSYASAGTQTAALYASAGTTSEYSAPSWSSGGALNTPRQEGSMAGTQTAALFFGGGPQTAASALTEEYDGSAWTAGGTMNTARGIQINGTGASQTAAVAFGGSGPTEPQRTTATELYDGTSWTTTGSLATARGNSSKGGSQGTSSSALCVGGYTPAVVSNAVEEFTNPTTVTKTITTS